MRVISGMLKGRKLAPPAGRHTRPTADRVKESIFNILGQQLNGLTVLDLFSGTGALAVEALSRGASSAVIVDVSQQAVALIRKNVSACGLQAKTRIVRWDIVRNLHFLDPLQDRFDLVFLDPPYGRQMIAPTIEALIANQVFNDHAVCVVEHPANEKLPDAFDNLIRQDQRTYGRTGVSFYRWLQP